MSTFVVTEKASGEEVYRYENDEVIEFGGFEFATHDHTATVTPEPEVQPQYAPPRRMTKLAFIGLMTQGEVTTLLEAAKTDVNVELFVRMLDWVTVEPDGTSVDRDDPRTVAGVRALFSEERANQILGVL